MSFEIFISIFLFSSSKWANICSTEHSDVRFVFLAFTVVYCLNCLRGCPFPQSSWLSVVESQLSDTNKTIDQFIYPSKTRRAVLIWVMHSFPINYALAFWMVVTHSMGIWSAYAFPSHKLGHYNVFNSHNLCVCMAHCANGNYNIGFDRISINIFSAISLVGKHFVRSVLLHPSDILFHSDFYMEFNTGQIRVLLFSLTTHTQVSDYQHFFVLLCILFCAAFIFFLAGCFYFSLDPFALCR